MRDVVVDTHSGPVVGEDLGTAVIFRGIPYAAPPVGELRFAAPRPHPGWDGVLDATAFGAAAPQRDVGPLSGLVPGMAPTVPLDEDCLTLNIWTPGTDGLTTSRPVMVWFHGGAFQLGASSLEVYDGERLCADEDVVVVTVNYRLGILGFLLLDDDTCSPNCGILDQLVALRWVQANIEAFGGDPDRVTIFGESAGGGSVLSLLASPLATGLFGAAIVQSGASSQFLPRRRAAKVATALFEHLGITDGDVAALRAVPWPQLLDAQLALGAALLGTVGTMPFHPTDDGEVLPVPWDEARRLGINAHVSLLIGTTAHEMRLFVDLDPTVEDLDRDGLAARVRAFGLDPAPVLAAYEERLFEHTWADRWFAVQTDVAMWLPALAVAEGHAAHSHDVWMYRFDWPAADPRLGACHGIDIPFPFGTIDRAGWDGFVAEPDEAQWLSARIRHHWAGFARNGDPGWPRYDTAARTTMVFDVEDHIVGDPHSTCRQALGG
jgi:para-nitrobenzyl esterase